MAKPNHDNEVVKSFIGESCEVMYNKCGKIKKILTSSITTAKKNQEDSSA